MSPELSKNSDQDVYQPPQSILETVLYCDDLTAAGDFYERVLGLKLCSHKPDRHRFYKIGRSMLLIFHPLTTQTADVRVADQTIPKHGSQGPGHIAFEVQADQFEAIRKRLVDHRVSIDCEVAWPGGGHSLYCRDPANNSIEFATRRLWFASS